MNLQTQNEKETEEISELVNEAAALPGAADYRNFYLIAIRSLGLGLFREALGEVKMRINEGAILNHGAYLTTILKDWIKEEIKGEKPGYSVQGYSAQSDSNQESLVYFGQTSLSPESLDGENPLQKMQVPFRKNFIQWAPVITNDYFVVNNEIMKSDEVETTIWIGGNPYKVPMIRGKTALLEEPRGQLKVEHMRILAALEKIWNQKGCPHINHEKLKVVIGVLDTTINEIVMAMGISRGGKQSDIIKAKLADLWKSGYFYKLNENEELKKMGLKEGTFSFLSNVQYLTRILENREETYVRIFFSESYTRQFLNRNVVSRPLDFAQIRNDIGFKLYLHIYPQLVARKPGENYSEELRNLIKPLGLKEAGWQSTKSQRKRQFEKALADINGRKAHDGRVFSLRIEQGLNDKDYLLVARLIDAEEGSHGNV